MFYSLSPCELSILILHFLVFSPRIWWRAIWCMLFARRWRCWRSRSRSCTRGTPCWSVRTRCSSRWPTPSSSASWPVSSARGAAHRRRCCCSSNTSSSATAPLWVITRGVRASLISPTWAQRDPPPPKNTRSDKHLVVDPVRKDSSYHRPLSSIKQKPRLCIQYAPFEDNNRDVFVYHQEPCFSVCTVLILGLHIIKTFTTPIKTSYSGSVFGCRRRGRGASAHHKTACRRLCQMAQRAWFVGATTAGRGWCNFARCWCGDRGPVKHPARIALPTNPHPISLQGWKRPQSWGRSGEEDSSSPSGGGRRQAPRLEE